MTTLKTAVVPKEIQDNAYEKNLVGGGVGRTRCIIIRDEKMTNDFRSCGVIPETCFFQPSISPCAYVCVIDVKTKGKFPWDHLVTLLFLSKVTE